MLNFQPLQLQDLPRLRAFFGYSGSRLCDTTPGSAFIWRDMYHTEWAVCDGSLYFKVDYPGLGETFTLPLGGGRTEHYRQIAAYCCRRDLPIAFYPVPKDELDRLLEFFPTSTPEPQRDAFDYLYRAEDLMYFRGKRFSGQRNHVNKFLKTYDNWSFRALTENDLPAVRAFLEEYAAGQDKKEASFQEDIAKTREVLDNFGVYDLLGGVLLAEGRVAGFALGEVLGDTLFTHIEKADRAVQGGYQMLVAQFAQRFAGGEVSFINREDDTGDAGLRTSKLSYQPVALLEKCVVMVDDPCRYGQRRA